MTEELIVRRDGALGRLTLNRPDALGALTTGMCEAMIDALVVWSDNPTIKTVLIDHEGPRGFCAGGDIRMLADSAAAGGAAAFEFFHTQYQLDHLISVYPKPVITVMDGVTMGGGVGLAMPSTYRIATERTRFAMPETGIGLFSDVGAGWHLPRLLGAAGVWIAYTGAKLRAADCLALDLASHLVPAAGLYAFKMALAEMPAAQAIAQHGRKASPDRRDGINCERINRLFRAPTLEDILDGLGSEGTAWSIDQLADIMSKSPLSLRVTERLLRAGRQAASLADDLLIEHRLARRLVVRPDFTEGVRAVIVDKDNAPAWHPASLAEVSEALVDEMFAPLPAGEEWTPLPDA